MDTVELQEYYPGELGIKRIENNADRVEIFMKTTTQRAVCPKCGKITDKKGGIHSKTVYDLPILGKQVKLNIKYSNFIYLNKECNKKYISKTILECKNICIGKILDFNQIKKINRRSDQADHYGGNALCAYASISVPSRN